MLYGENFLMRLGLRRKMYGFYTTRYVEAENPEDAENKAVELIRNDEKLMANTKNKPWQSSWQKSPMIYLEEMAEIEKSEMAPQEGYAFFPMDEKEIL
jgi:hypothetical protein